LALTKLVEVGVPFHNTVEFNAPKPAPFTVRVNVGPPAGADDGLRLLIDKGPGAAAVIVNVEPFDIAAPVLTVTVAVPCVAMRLPEITAVT